MFAKAIATSQQQVGVLHVMGLFSQREDDFIADHLENMGGLMDFKVKEILSTTSWVKYSCFRYSRIGVGKLRPAGHMRPAVSFCAARTRLSTAVFNLCDRVHSRIE